MSSHVVGCLADSTYGNRWNLTMDFKLNNKTKKRSKALVETIDNYGGLHVGTSKLTLVEAQSSGFTPAQEYFCVPTNTQQETVTWVKPKEYTLPSVPKVFKPFKVSDAFMHSCLLHMDVPNFYHNGVQELNFLSPPPPMPEPHKPIKWHYDGGIERIGATTAILYKWRFFSLPNGGEKLRVKLAEYQAFGFNRDSSNDESVSWIDSMFNFVFDSLKNIASFSVDFIKSAIAKLWQWLGDYFGKLFPVVTKAYSDLIAFMSNISFAIILVALSLIGVPRPIIAVAMSVYISRISTSIPVRIVSVLLAAVGGAEIGCAIANVVAEYQGGVSVDLFNKVIIAAFGILIISRLPSDKAWDTLFTRCDRIPKAITGVMSLTKHFESLYDTLRKASIELLGGQPDIGFGIPEDVERNFSEIMALADRNMVAKIPTDPSIRERIQAAYYAYYNLRRQYHSNHDIKVLLDKYQTPINNLMQRVNDHTVGETETRQKPVLTMFRGSTGVGKSELLHFLAVDLLHDMHVITQDMTDEQVVHKVNTSVFSRQVEVEYWDTYNNQPICLYDDFGQLVDSHSNPNIEFMEFIRAANRFPMTLHMAALAQKNTTFFTSRHILATTNLRAVNPTSLISPDAVQSRIDFAYQVSVKPEYQVDPTSSRDIDHRIAREKLPTDDNGAPISGTYVYRFQKWDVTRNVVDAEFLDYYSVVEEICRKQQQYAKSHKATDSAIVSHFRRHATYQGWTDMIYGKSQSFEWPHMYSAIEAFDTVRGKLNVVKESTVGKFLVRTEVLVILSLLFGCMVSKFAFKKKEPLQELDDNQIIEFYFMVQFAQQHGVAQIVDYERCGGFPKGPSLESARAFLSFFYANETFVTGASKYDLIDIWFDWSPKTIILSLPTCYRDVLKRVERVTSTFPQDYSISDFVEDCQEGRETSLDTSLRPGINFESGRREKTHVKVKLERPTTSTRATMESGRRERTRVNARLESFTSAQSQEMSRVVSRSFYTVNDTFPIFAVKDRWYLMNRHYFNMLEGKMIVRHVDADGGYEVDKRELVVRELGRDPDSDVICVQLPIRTNCNRDLTKHFIPKRELQALKSRHAILHLPPTQQRKAHVQKNGKIFNFATEPIELGQGAKRMTYFEVDIRSSEGDCGGIYVLDSNDVSRKIVGMHFAGALEGGAMGVPITTEDLQCLEGTTLIEPTELENGENVLRHAIPHGTVLRAPAANLKSSIIPTPIHNLVEKTGYAPSKLGFITGPVGLRGLRKVSGDVPMIDANKLEQAAASYKAKMTGEKRYNRVLTFKEAVQGIEGEPLMRGINRSKSAGYPWCLKTGKGKREWFGSDEWEFGPKAEVVERHIDNKISLMKHNRYMPSLYMDTLKDETRPIAKVEAGKTRVFAAASMDFVIMFRMYFLGFLAFIMENRIDNEVAVGINAHSPEWHKLAKKMLTHGRGRMIAGDFSDYDGTLHPDILYKICDIANEWYNDGQDTIRRLIFEDIVHSWHVTGKEVNQWTHSQPSGNPGTAVINSIYNSLVMRLALISASDVPIHKFNDYITMISYGDDNLLAVSEECEADQEVFTRGLAKIGMTYTSETKEAQVGYRNLEDVAFLKRGFRFEQNIGLWVAPLAKASINERLNWQHRVQNPLDVLNQNVEGAIIEWSLHDSESFKFWTERIQKVMLARGENCAVYPQNYYLCGIRDGSLAAMFEHLTYV